MFIYKSRFLTRGEVWYDEDPGRAKVDWLYFMQRPEPPPHSRWKYFYTQLIDLQKSPEQILAAMEEKTAKKIIEAQQKDKLRCEECDPRKPGLMDEVEQMWNAFAIAQKTPLLERPWLEEMLKAGALEVLAARDPENNLLAYHLVLLTPKRARQLIAISPFKSVPTVAWRNAISRANCFIHYNRFVNWSQRGIHSFDFGGWYPGKTDIRLLGINAFKKSFGGKVVREYECEKPVSLRGWVLLNGARLWARLKQGRAATPAENKVDDNEPQQGKVSPAF